VISRIIHSTSFAQDGARQIVNRGREAIEKHGLFRLGLTGGRSPKAINEALVAQPGALSWNKVQITFGDERCVPPDHEDSNYRLARESLIEPAQIPEGNVFRMRGEIDPAAAAQEYEAKLAAVAARLNETRYTHDLLLLGLGEDGHIASLFPGSAALDEKERQILPIADSPKPPPQRLTMTLPLINSARHILFLVPDPAKRTLVEKIIDSDPAFPASRVRALEQVTWLLGW
jgi:6-phosphogluconolactonase